MTKIVHVIAVHEVLEAALLPLPVLDHRMLMVVPVQELVHVDRPRIVMVNHVHQVLELFF